MWFKRSEKAVAAMVIALFVAIAAMGAVWLAGVIHWTPTGLDLSPALRSPPPPPLALIPWRLDWRHPERGRLFPARLPYFRRFTRAPYWWGRGGPRPQNQFLAGLCQPSPMANQALQARAMAHVKRIFHRRDWRKINDFRSLWLPALLRAGRYRLVGWLCHKAVLAQPGNTGWVQFLLLTQVQCLLARHQPRRALVTAVRLYNVCAMRYTGEALLLLEECLRQSAAEADGAGQNPFSIERRVNSKSKIVKWWRQMTGAGGVVDQFTVDQVRGARINAQPAQLFGLPKDFADLSIPDSTPTAAPSNVLARIKVAPDPYLSRAALITGEDFYSLMSRGNLYLLANRPRLASAVFARAYDLANHWQINQAEESMARTLKAWSKTIGPANRWVRYVNAVGQHVTRRRTK